MASDFRAVFDHFGWEVSDDFVQRYEQDAWVYHLANAAARLLDAVEAERDAHERVGHEVVKRGEWAHQFAGEKIALKAEVERLYLLIGRIRGVARWAGVGDSRVADTERLRTVHRICEEAGGA